jgi:hypothetical protein
MSDHETTLRELANDGYGSGEDGMLTVAQVDACLAGADALRDYRNVMANRDGMKSLNDELYAKAQETEAWAARLFDAYDAQQELTVQAGAEALRRGTCGTCKHWLPTWPGVNARRGTCQNGLSVAAMREIAPDDGCIKGYAPTETP